MLLVPCIFGAKMHNDDDVTVPFSEFQRLRNSDEQRSHARTERPEHPFLAGDEHSSRRAARLGKGQGAMREDLERGSPMCRVVSWDRGYSHFRGGMDCVRESRLGHEVLDDCWVGEGGLALGGYFGQVILW